MIGRASPVYQKHSERNRNPYVMNLFRVPTTTADWSDSDGVSFPQRDKQKHLCSKQLYEANENLTSRDNQRST